MGLSSYLASLALLATTTLAQNAQVVSYSNNNYGISVNVPANTASSGSGSIYFQINAPSGTQWVGFGQGNQMSGANMFIVYARDSTNVTISPRSGTGHVMPQFNSGAQVTLLAGSGIHSDGSLVANVRCDSCLSWSGGTMDPTSSSSSWIWAHKSGSALNSADQSAQIQQHSSDGLFTLDLTKGTGGNSNNPFVAASNSNPSSAVASSSASGSATQTASGSASSSTDAGSESSSATATASQTNSVSQPAATSGSDNNQGSSSSSDSGSEEASSDNTDTIILAHGVIMSLLFIGLFPLASLTLYLPTPMKVRFIHAPLQMLGTVLVIIGMGLGIVLGQRIGEFNVPHMILGLIVVVSLVLFQPAMGVYQHLHYAKTGGRSIFGQIHRWLGRTLLILGVINGGLGFQLSGNSGHVPYAVVAAIVFLVYIAVLFWAWRRSGRTPNVEAEKATANRGYEMQKPRQVGHSRLASNEINGSAYREQHKIQNNRF